MSFSILRLHCHHERHWQGHSHSIPPPPPSLCWAITPPERLFHFTITGCCHWLHQSHSRPILILPYPGDILLLVISHSNITGDQSHQIAGGCLSIGGLILLWWRISSSKKSFNRPSDFWARTMLRIILSHDTLFSWSSRGGHQRTHPPVASAFFKKYHTVGRRIYEHAWILLPYDTLYDPLTTANTLQRDALCHPPTVNFFRVCSAH